MKELPILFSTEMVQAILAGRKTITRRIMKPQIQPCNHTIYEEAEWKDEPTRWSKLAMEKGFAYCELCGNGTDYSNDFGGLRCPYGKPGDLLWVRETWFPAAINGDKVLVGYHDKDPDTTREFTTEKIDFYWKQMDKARMIPSIHMPKEAARIWLEVADIHIERLQEISEEDAKAEGVDSRQTELGISYFDYETGFNNGLFTAKRSFQSLWSKINGAESWNANLWVWVISFKVLSTTGKPELKTASAIP